jgi:hypothetical protein
MRRLVLLALLLSGGANAEEGAGALADASTGHDASRNVSASTPLRLPPRESFRLFPAMPEESRVEFAGLPEEKRLFHQAGDPDSTFTIGKPSPEGEVHVLAVIDVNEIFLKAIPPDPLISPADTRPRAAGSFLPVDSQGRPYQLRLGARLVW